MIFRNRSQRSMPQLNTSSLPDLIFTVLFFFMVVTHMRKTTIKVEYRVPQGTELTRLVKKSAVSYIYIGKLPHSTHICGVATRYCRLHSSRATAYVARRQAATDCLAEGRRRHTHVARYRCETSSKKGKCAKDKLFS